MSTYAEELIRAYRESGADRPEESSDPRIVAGYLLAQHKSHWDALRVFAQEHAEVINAPKIVRTADDERVLAIYRHLQLAAAP